MKKRILVVEDDEHFGRQLLDLLVFLGHEVDWAKTGPSGLDAFAAARADLVIVDLMIPEMNGVVLVRKLRGMKGGATVPVLMMSAVYRNPRMFERELRTLNIVEFLAKPFSLIDLGRTIGVILDGGAEIQSTDARLTETGSWRVTGVRDAVGEGVPGFDRVGSFDQIRLFRMLYEAFRRHVAGRLTLMRGKSVRELFFLNGYPVWATSDRAEERLGSVLVQRKAITDVQLREIESLAFREGLSFHRAALESGLVSSRRLLRAERARVRSVVINSFVWVSGEYEFQAGDEFVDRVGIFEVNPIRCLSSAIRRHVGVNELASDIEHRSSHILVRGSRFRELYPYVRLPENLSDLGDAITGHCTVGALFQRYPTASEDLIKVLWLMFQLSITDSVDSTEMDEKELASLRGAGADPSLPDSVVEAGPVEALLPDQVSHPVGKAILHDYLAYMGEDLYTFLGLGRDASDSEIDAAYERLRHRYSLSRLSEDVGSDVRRKAKELLGRLSHAYEVLRSGESRREYDDRLLAVQTITDEFPAAPSKLREAKALMARSAWVAALPILRGLAQSHPGSADVLACLGLSVYRTGQGDRKATQEAVAYLEEALQMKTDHRLARRYMADISRELEEMGGYDDLVAVKTEIDPSEVWKI